MTPHQRRHSCPQAPHTDWFALSEHWYLLHSFSEIRIPLRDQIFILSQQDIRSVACACEWPLGWIIMPVLRRCIVEKGSTIVWVGGKDAYPKYVINITNIEENTKHVRRRWRCARQELRSGGVELDLCPSLGLCGVRDKFMQIPGIVRFNYVGLGIRICVSTGTAILGCTKIKKGAPGEA